MPRGGPRPNGACPERAVGAVEGARPAGRGGPRPNSGPPLGNLNAYKHGRTSRLQARLLHLIAQDPEARELILTIARRQRQRRRHAEREANRILDTIHRALQDRALSLQAAQYEDDRRIPPLPDTPHPST